MMGRWTWLWGLLGLAVAWGCGGGSPKKEACGQWECGKVNGVDCGSCAGATEVCLEGRCVDVCAGRECGQVEGRDCGSCPGAHEGCSEQGHCIDLCAGRQCGRVGAVDCGTCPYGAVCNVSGRCVAGDCPPDMAAVHGVGVCMDRWPMKNAEAVAILNEIGTDCSQGRYPEKPHAHCDVYSAEYRGGVWTLEPGTEDDYPSVYSWYTADALCRWQDKRLCHVAELREACAGPEGWRYPYGDTYEACQCFCYEEEDCPCQCESPYGGIYIVLGGGGFYTADTTIEGDTRYCVAFGGTEEFYPPLESITCDATAYVWPSFVRCCKDLEEIQ